jgi:hypothetical protein
MEAVQPPTQRQTRQQPLAPRPITPERNRWRLPAATILQESQTPEWAEAISKACQIVFRENSPTTGLFFCVRAGFLNFTLGPSPFLERRRLTSTRCDL